MLKYKPEDQVSWILEFWASKIMKSGFYGTKMKQQNPIKTLKIKFEYISSIKLSQHGHAHFGDIFLLNSFPSRRICFSLMPYFFRSLALSGCLGYEF